MARSATLGNGHILVGIDEHGYVRDFYYPYVGLSNHVSGASGNYVHRIGVFVDDELSWLSDPEWEVACQSPADSGVNVLHAVHRRLQITVTSTDAVHNEENVFLRSFTIGNEANAKREVKVFFSQQFRIHESRRGDTGYYDPRANAIMHYKGSTVFLINAMHGGKTFDEYNIGLFGIEGKEGTYFDAYDGELAKNPIEHGSVDSVIGLDMTIAGQAYASCQYWIVVADTIKSAHQLNQYVLDETPDRLIKSTEQYWTAWLGKESIDMSMFNKSVQELYQASLFVMRTHADDRGAIIASSDTDMLHHGRDTYSYVWPRDGAMIAHAFDVAGYSDIARAFYKFITAQIESGGYLMHKYAPDGALGSSWHAWLIEGEPEYPIQEDETALVLYMLYQHYVLEKDLEFIESIYNPFIEPAAEFMVEFVESRLGLPQNSYDLWEEKFGIHTYTASTVYGALLAAAAFAKLLGKTEPARTYTVVAQRIQQAILDQLYKPELGMFVKSVRAYNQTEDVTDYTVDMSSFFGPLYFGVIDPDDERVATAFATIEERLAVRKDSGGYVRYEGDSYYKMQDEESPNPWVVTTLWVAQYHIMKARTLADLEVASSWLDWTTSHASPALMLSEQMHPHTRAHLSTAPLVWSHAEFVLTCDAYRRKYLELSETA